MTFLDFLLTEWAQDDWPAQDFPPGANATDEREKILAQTIAGGWRFVADSDSRDVGTAHPHGNLWDNGADAIEELEHLLQVREIALRNFSERNIRVGRPMATLEEVLVPLYLLHRYQLQAVGKLVGGQEFSYALRGDGQVTTQVIDADRQRAALLALLRSLDPSLLRLPDELLESIPGRPTGFGSTRESFPRDTGIVFDPFGAAESAVALTLDVLIEPSRAARMIASNAGDAEKPGFGELVDALLHATWYSARRAGPEGEIQRLTNNQVLDRLLVLGTNREADHQVRAICFDAVSELDRWLELRVGQETNRRCRAHYRLARHRIEQVRDDPSVLESRVPVVPPPGSPVGDFAPHGY